MRFAAAALAACLILAPAIGRTQDKVTLHFWVSWDPAQPDGIAAKQQLAAFETSHPDIKVEVQNITYDALHDKLITAVAGGQGPDMSWGLPEWLGELNRMGALMDLNDFAKTWPSRAAIYPNVLAGLTGEGHLMALPHYLGIRALLWHADMLQQAGIAADDEAARLFHATVIGLAVMHLARLNKESANEVRDGLATLIRVLTPKPAKRARS